MVRVVIWVIWCYIGLCWLFCVMWVSGVSFVIGVSCVIVARVYWGYLGGVIGVILGSGGYCG